MVTPAARRERLRLSYGTVSKRLSGFLEFARLVEGGRRMGSSSSLNSHLLCCPHARFAGSNAAEWVHIRRRDHPSCQLWHLTDLPIVHNRVRLAWPTGNHFNLLSISADEPVVNIA